MLHAESLRLFGGAAGVRDLGLLQSALGRPQHLFAYQPEADVFALAAAYGFGIARDRPARDGNKRTALLAMRAFLFLNGQRLAPEEADTVQHILHLVAGELDEDALSNWLRAHSRLRDKADTIGLTICLSKSRVASSL